LPIRRPAVACVRGSRAPMTRSKSPSFSTIRFASSVRCWPSASMMAIQSLVAARMAVFTEAPLPLL